MGVSHSGSVRAGGVRDENGRRTRQSREPCNRKRSCELRRCDFISSQIRFHHLHGRNIKLSDANRHAVRVRSFKQGLLFSSRPLRPNELFEIEIVELERVWAGSIRLGLTDLDPGSLQQSFPPYAIPNLTQQPGCYVLAGSAMHGVAAPTGVNPQLTWGNEGYPLNLDNSAVVCDGCRIGVMYDVEGRMFYMLNGEPQGLAQEGLAIDRDIYAIVDVYGQAKAVRIVERRCNVSVVNKFVVMGSSSLALI